MIVHHGVHVWPHFVDRAVDEALEIRRAAAFVDRRPVELVFDDVVALDLRLTPADLARIEQAVPAAAVAGTRYLPAVLAHMDSERPR
jgi:hypothetical protein